MEIQKELDELNRTIGQSKTQQPTQQSTQQRQSNDVLEYLVSSLTNSANALIDYIGHRCTSVRAFDELVARHTELLAQLRLEYKQRLEK